MEILDRLQHFGFTDAAALAILVVGWAVIGWIIENPSAHKPSVTALMARYRREWFVQFVTRDPRIFDSNILATMREGTTFFASACMISIGGGLALLGNTERLLGVARDLTLETGPAVVWEIKLIVILLFVANAFLKFVWAHRLFGYCAVVMASVPNDVAHPGAQSRAQQAAELNITASRSFTRGMRSIYFALAALAWLLGAAPLVGAVLLTLVVIWRREFASQSRTVLLTPSQEPLT
ncbi:DUF599 domain-containing protein [Aliiroseovarius sp. YM-037]|uniref:DUF599 domain-containing protein n=1 Tax=Aliiroseovarius sp. YM-037 TaxID=3341728 RepID=UPI003A8000F8